MPLRLSKHLTCVTAASAIVFILMSLVFKSQFQASFTASKHFLKPSYVRKYSVQDNTDSIQTTEYSVNDSTKSIHITEYLIMDESEETAETPEALQTKQREFVTSDADENQETHQTNNKEYTTLEPEFAGGRIKWMELWSHHYNNTRNLPEDLKIYKTALNIPDAELTLTLLQVLTMMMELHNITYFIYGGTLLGSLRHHGNIPWDDDTDIMVDYNQRGKLRDILQQLRPAYLLHSPDSFTTWKFFSKQSRPTMNIYTQKWKWPFIDIFFFKRKKNVIKDVSWAGDNVIFPKKLIFPLSKRPYAFMNLYAPCDSYAFVNMSYNLSECVSRDWDHSKELKIYKNTKTIHCDILKQYYPFVYRRNSGKDVIENLMFKEVNLQTRVLPQCKYKEDQK